MPWKQCLEENTYHSVDTLKIKFSMTSASTLRNCKINSKGNTNETRKNNWKDQSKTLIEIKSRKVEKINVNESSLRISINLINF